MICPLCSSACVVMRQGTLHCNQCGSEKLEKPMSGVETFVQQNGPVPEVSIYSIYMKNVPEELRSYQKQVVEKFLPENVHFEQYLYEPQTEDIHHTFIDAHDYAIMECFKKNTSPIFILLDIDCIPLSRNAILFLISRAKAGALVGCAHTASHIQNCSTFVGPFCMAFSVAKYQELGSPSFLKTTRTDCAGELTSVWQIKKQEVNFLLPSAVQNPRWKLQSYDIGLGTTYADAFYHAFMAREGTGNQLFIDKCKEILNTPESIAVVLPTRHRVDNFRRFYSSIVDTADKLPEIAVYVDDDDQVSLELVKELGVKYTQGPRKMLSQCWNDAAGLVSADILMYAADDLVFRTKGWDTIVLNKFMEYPDKIIAVHGDDKNYGGGQLATHAFLHRRWINTLGYFVPPYFEAWFDNWITEISDAIGRRVCVPFVNEHFHHSNKTAPFDHIYQEYEERRKKDIGLFASMNVEKHRDIEKLRSAMIN